MIVGCLFLTFLDTMKTQCVSKASSNLTSNCQSTENSFKTMVKTKIFYQKVSVEVTKNNLNKAACKLVSSIFSQSVSLFIHCVKLEAKRDETLLRKPFVELVLLQTNNCISVFFVRAASTNFRDLTHAVWRAGKNQASNYNGLPVSVSWEEEEEKSSGRNRAPLMHTVAISSLFFNFIRNLKLCY